MYAFAIWDKVEQRLLLARDRVGIKPLYVYRDGVKILFGSELKPILTHPNVDRDVDPLAIDEYLAYGVVPGDRCIFKNIQKLLPGHTLSISRRDWNAQPRRYWEINFESDDQLSLDDWREAVAAKLRESVALHMVADVPVGAFLSGGLDSSLMVAMAADAVPSPLKTFSIGFREDQFNELPYARKVAKHFGTTHHEEIVRADSVELIEQLTQYYDEPFADSSSIATFLVSRLASRHVKVVLSGDGGDEAFGGYSRYVHDLKEAQIRESLPNTVREMMAVAGRVWPKFDWLPRPLRLKTAFTNLSLDNASAYANTLTLCRQPNRNRLISAGLRDACRQHDTFGIVRDGFNRASHGDALAGMISADMATLLPDDYLVKVDRASMAHGLEVRPPMLDHELLELCAQVPSEWKIRGGETKWLLKDTLGGQLPSSIINRPKQGFEIPVDDWFRGPLRSMYEDMVLNQRSPIAALIDVPAAKALFMAHQSRMSRQGSTLWSLLSLASWSEAYLRPDSTPQEQEHVKVTLADLQIEHDPYLLDLANTIDSTARFSKPDSSVDANQQQTAQKTEPVVGKGGRR